MLSFYGITCGIAAHSRQEIYLFDKPRNIVEVHKRLVRGEVYYRTVVIPEGFTMFDIARAIEAAGLGPADDFISNLRRAV